MDTSDNSFYSSEAKQGSIVVSSEELKFKSDDISNAAMTNESFTIFTQELSVFSSIEEQVTFSLEKMEQALRNNQGANLKLFWAIRKHCLPLFHQVENVGKRAEFWRRYIDLTKEGRHIKSLQDEEGTFVVGQIELAISCLEQDITHFLEGTNPLTVQEEQSVFLETQTLEKRKSFYKELHTSLVWLSSFSARIIDLRKELMNVGMRMRLKSKFFQHLSSLGNQVFPKRKELIEKVSDAFSEDVESFVAKYFSRADKDALKRSVFFLRKEIKNLQQAAKCLAVSSTVFSDTRLKLSKCWDQLKGLEKEIRQEQSRLRVASAENSKDVREQLAGIAQVLEEGGDLFRIRKDLDAAAKRIRSLDLIHDDVVALKAELQVLFEKLKEKQDAAEQVYQEQLARDKQIRQEAIKELTEKIKLFSERCTSGDIHSETRSEWQELKESLTKAAFLSASERISLDNRLNLTLQHITAYFEEQLLSSPDSREKLTNMRQVLSQRQERRKELKDKLEQDKKLLGSSGLDFDRAMQYSALVEEDKRALEELDQSILDLKRQIQQLT
ncbi:hypothetical protein [Chlamydia psittaci]|uniref:hypothetical protein n=1 Tax=Chlamydia psittaci TaxID=83554 RepID=UPI0006D6D805|nr:hypothetical protein [Chlamydia psittaci]KPZ36245.1 hypothetical protein GWE_02905 [Chlamydia psittaci NJ1]MDS0919435.1 hypothetical protein [Chlamydia psittaci]MDS0989466.1 hypothetical protein [Chlamydia psittaci]MDS0995441.1 hypothetical protein [Chlamydia psittaci]MDS1001125.1 hypothetical protein [Chlamydia psittaci]